MLPPWLMRFTDAAAARRRGASGTKLVDDLFENASAAFRNKGGVATAAKALLAKAPAPATDASFDRVRATFGVEDAAVVTAAGGCNGG